MENDSDFSNLSVCLTSVSSVAFTKCPKQEKRLLLHPVINTLDAYKASLYLSISLKTTNTIKYILVNSSTTEIFINYSFVKRHYLNIYKLLWLVLIYNIDDTSSKDSQISEVIDVILQYQSHSEQAFLIVSSLDKQQTLFIFCSHFMFLFWNIQLEFSVISQLHDYIIQRKTLNILK